MVTDVRLGIATPCGQVVVEGMHGKKLFEFDKVYGPMATNAEVRGAIILAAVTAAVCWC